jgi:hypothetical protein
MSLEKLKAEISTFEQSHAIQFNSWKDRGVDVSGQEVLEKQILQKYEERQGVWRAKVTGSRVDMQSIIQQELKNSKGGVRPLLKNTGALSRYASPFSKRSEEQIQKHAGEVARLVKAQLERLGIVFLSEAAKKKTIDVISEKFLVVDSDTGPRYHKISDEGIASPSSWSFEELTGIFGLNRFIDQDRTQLQKQLFESNLKEQAKKLSGATKEDDQNFKTTLERLKKVDTPTVGKKLAIDANFIRSEFEKEARLETGLLGDITLNDHQRIIGMVNQRMTSLNSVENIAPYFNEIEIEEPKSWDI